VNVDELDGRTQLGIGQGVLDAVADGLFEVQGRAPEATARLVEHRDALRNPFYSGD
jgi:hypothetical protein